MFMGIDVRYAFLSSAIQRQDLGYIFDTWTTPNDGGLDYWVIISMALIGFGMLITNRAFCMHFLSISWLLIQNDQGISNQIAQYGSVYAEESGVRYLCAAVILTI